MHRTPSLSVALCLAFFCTAAEGQSSSEGAPAAIDLQVRAELSQSLSRRDVARVRTTWGLFEVSTPRLHNPTTLDFAVARPVGATEGTADLPRPLPLADISEIQLQRSAAGRGAAVGAAVLGGFTVLATLPFTRPCRGGLADFGNPCGASAGDVIMAAMVAGTGGALVGALIGAPIKQWKTIYRTP